MQQMTLGAFIQSEMKRRSMSIRQFSDFVGVTHPVISKFRYHGIKEKHASRHIGDPSLDFLAKLAKATSVDLCALVGLIHPEVVQKDSAKQILIDQILNQVLIMTPVEVDKTATFILGTLSQRVDEGGDQKQLTSGHERK